MLINYVYLVIAVMFEVIATTALKLTEGFTRLVPSLVSIGGYALAFYFLSLPLKNMPIGIIYAFWCAAGIVFITIIGWIWFRQPLDLPALAGMGLIMAGVIVINLWSKTLVH
jgi:small multidrug resistance pump